MGSTGTTGDLKNNIIKMKRLFREIKYKEEINTDEVSAGQPNQYILVYKYLFSGYSNVLAKKLEEKDIQLPDIADTKTFIEVVYKVMRDVFDYKPLVPKDKFMSASHAERKVLMCIDVVSKIKVFNQRNQPKKPVKKHILSTSMCTERPASSSKVEMLSQSMHSDSQSSTSVPSRAELTVPARAPIASGKRASPRPSLTARPNKYKLQRVAASNDGFKKPVIHIVDPQPGKSQVLTPTPRDNSSVKVVLNTEKARREGERHKMRAMDMVGKTPVRPNVHSNFNLDQTEKVEDLLLRMTAIEDRLAKLEMVNTRVEVEVDLIPQAGRCKASLTPGQVRDVMALIENAMEKGLPKIGADMSETMKEASLPRTSTVEDLSNFVSPTIDSAAPSNFISPTIDPAASCNFVSPTIAEPHDPSASSSPFRDITNVEDVFASPTSSSDSGVTPDKQKCDSSPECTGNTVTSSVSDAIKQVVRASVSDSEASPLRPSARPNAEVLHDWFASLKNDGGKPM